jgi:thiamine biosynthesis lipoprotein ApbE
LDIERKLDIKASGQGFSGRFQAMGSPCELLSEAGTPQEAERLVGIAASEAWRIEDKFSRYHDGNIVDRINKGAGQSIAVDAETAQLLDFADTLYKLKEYAVDRVILELRQQGDTPCLVNFGGDLAVTGPPGKRRAWTVGIESEVFGGAEKLIELQQGALATSGNAERAVSGAVS